MAITNWIGILFGVFLLGFSIGWNLAFYIVHKRNEKHIEFLKKKTEELKKEYGNGN